MLRFTQDSFVDIEKYEEHLKSFGKIYIDAERLRNSLNYEISRRNTEYDLAYRTMNANSANRYLDLSSGNIIDYLVKHESCNPQRFKAKNAGGSSIDSSKVLKPLYDNGYAKEFLSHYILHKSLKSQIGLVTGLLQSLSTDDIAYDRDGRPLNAVNFSIEQQLNLRYYYNQYAIVSIPHSFVDTISVPKGMVVVAGDFAQSDFRIGYNLFLRDQSNAKIMDNSEDKYEGQSQLISIKQNQEFNYSEFKRQRDLYKLYCLATLYGTRTGQTPEANRFIQTLADYYMACPRYADYYRRIEQRCDLGLPINVQSYFGHTESIFVNSANRNRTIFQCLNYPVQGTTSEIMILVVNTILDRFYSLGYTKEDISVYFVRHDEPLFIMKEEVLKDSWIFRDCGTIFVDNWTPLRIDFNFGYRYTVPDDDLMNIYDKVCKDNRDKFTKIESEDSFDFTFCPIPKTLELGISAQQIGDKHIVCVYSPEKHACDYLLVNSADKEDVCETINTKVANIDEKLYLEGYRGIIVWNNLFERDIFNRSMFCKYKIEENPVTAKAQILAINMCRRYALKNNIEYVPTTDTLSMNGDLINSVGKLNYVL